MDFHLAGNGLASMAKNVCLLVLRPKLRICNSAAGGPEGPLPPIYCYTLFPFTLVANDRRALSARPIAPMPQNPMRISCLQENLAKGLSIAGRVTSSRVTMPVLENILIAVENGRIRLVCTNLDVSINVWINGTVEQEGALTVPVRLLTEFVNLLPSGQPVHLTYLESRQLEVSCGQFRTAFNTIEANQFPDVQDSIQGMESTLQLDTHELRTMIEETAFAAATGEDRPNLACVQVELADAGLTLAATDGFRLAVRHTALEQTEQDQKILVPARALSELSRILADADSSKPVDVAVTNNHSQILANLHGLSHERGSFVEVLLICQLVDAHFPDYNRIIPQEGATSVIVDRNDLLQATRASFLLTRENNNIVTAKFNTEEDCIEISSESNDRGDSRNKLKARISGEALDISFNGQYLIDALTHIQTEFVVMDMTQNNRPAKLCPSASEDSKGRDFLQVIMPMTSAR